LGKGFTKFLLEISNYSALLPLVIVFFYSRIKKDNNYLRYWVILLYCILSFLEFLVYRFFHAGTKPVIELIVLSTFTIFEYSFFAYFLYLNINNNSLKKLIIILSILFVGYALFHFKFNTDKNFDSVPASVECILIIIYCIFYFFDKLNDPSINFVYSTPSFWIIVGFLIYLSGTLFLFLYAANLPRKESMEYWFINDICNIIKNILFAIALSMNKKKLANQSSMKKSYNI
jgi:hypothetical protein